MVQTNSTRSAKICPNLHFWRGGGDGPRPTQPKVPRSVQICIGGGDDGPDQLNPKCQDLSKSAFLGEGDGPDKLNPKCQDLSKSALFWGGGGVVVQRVGAVSEILNQKFWQLECVVHHR